MVMTLHSSVSGAVTYNKRPGAVLNAGNIIARLEVTFRLTTLLLSISVSWLGVD